MIHNLRRLLASLIFGWMPMTGWAAAPTGPAEHPAPSAVPTESFPHRLLGDIEHDIAAVEPWLDRYGFAAVFAAVGVEGFGIPAPGQTLLIAGAVTAATQNQFHIGLLLLTAFVAAILGSSLGYLIGRRGGRALLRRFRVDERHLQRVEQGFSRYGGGLIVIGRFFDGLRQLNGIAAGILEMPWWTSRWRDNFSSAALSGTPSGNTNARGAGSLAPAVDLVGSRVAAVAGGAAGRGGLDAIHLALAHPYLQHGPQRLRLGLEVQRQVRQGGLTPCLQVALDLCEDHACAPAAARAFPRPLRAQARKPASTATSRSDRPMIQAPELTGWRSKVAAW